MDGDEGFEGLGSGQGDGQGGNPAWNDFLSVIPQDLHEKVTPVLQQWDTKVQNGYQKVHQEYEPWKAIIKGSDPETTQYALQMLSALENDPKSVYKAIGDFYKDQLGDLVQPGAGAGGQGQGEPNNKDLDEKPWLADLNAIKQQNEMLTRVISSQQQSQQNAAADARLDNDLSAAKKTHGEFDENYVLGLLMANPQATVDDAVKTWKESITTWTEKLGMGGPKPFFMGGGSSIPGNGVNIKQATDKQTKDVVVQYLQAAAMQNKQ